MMGTNFVGGDRMSGDLMLALGRQAMLKLFPMSGFGFICDLGPLRAVQSEVP